MIRIYRGDNSAHSGVTIIELLVVVAIIGITSAIAIPSFAFVLRRERVNAVALEIAGWLEEVRSLSARSLNTEVIIPGSDEANKGGCAIVLGGDNSNAKSGDVIAAIETVDNEVDCDVRNPVLRIPDTQGQAFSIKIIGQPQGAGAGGGQGNACDPSSGIICSGSLSLFFTPRGMWDSESISNQDDFELRVSLADGKGPTRCVRLSNILGSIDIGTSSGDIAGGCDKYGSI